MSSLRSFSTKPVKGSKQMTPSTSVSPLLPSHLLYTPSHQLTKYSQRQPSPSSSSSSSMDFFFITLHLLLHLLYSSPTSASLPACKSTCGSLPVKYPLGTGPGCGSPRFHPSVSCSSSNQLLLTTHTGSYPITSISYPTSALTISPPLMSTCSSMHSSPNFGLDWATPFQMGPSIFLLLSCTTPSSSLTFKGSPLCDSSNAHLCAAIYTCPSVVSLGLPLFAPTNSCCVYSPANLGPHGDLDLEGLKCAGYASVVSLGEYPTDPSRWEYGVSLQFSDGGLDTYNFATACEACEKSEGACGYAPPSNYFVCVCKNGVNTSTDCYGQVAYWNSNGYTPKHFSLGTIWLVTLLVMILWLYL